MKRSLLAGALLTVLLLGACGTREPVTLTETDCRTAAVAADFSITLLRNAAKPDKTTLLSPYSVLLALGMAANGAGGRTLEEMEYALGAKTDDLNHWLAACRLAEDGKVVSDDNRIRIYFINLHTFIFCNRNIIIGNLTGASGKK